MTKEKEENEVISALLHSIPNLPGAVKLGYLGDTTFLGDCCFQPVIDRIDTLGRAMSLLASHPELHREQVSEVLQELSWFHSWLCSIERQRQQRRLDGLPEITYFAVPIEAETVKA